MNDKAFSLRNAAVAVLILFAAFSRALPHPSNFVPVMALGVFGGALFADRRLSFVIPIAAMILSDAFLGFSEITIFVYLSLIAAIYIGVKINGKISVKNVFLSAIAGAIVFFIVSNFGAWLLDPTYRPLSFESLIRCYYLALPFFRNTLLGNLTYFAVLFGAFSLAERYYPALSADNG